MTKSEPLLSTKFSLPTKNPYPIAMIGCGGITEHHLSAYRDAGWEVSALCDLDLERAKARRDQFFPKARIYQDYRKLLASEDAPILDVTTHPEERVAILRDCIEAKRHILSQKPFTTDLSIGQELCDLADRNGVTLAVNQNGRFSPHFYTARKAIEQGKIGVPFSAHLSVHWDHSWVAGTPFESVKHLILFDFAIHWFDILRCFLPHAQPRKVWARTMKSPNQTIDPPMLAQATIEWDAGLTSLAFDATVPFGPFDRTYIAGTEGAISSTGVDYHQQVLTLTNAEGTWTPKLEGRWFSDAFAGTMGELISSIVERRTCELNARDNLKSLALCFAAVASAETGNAIEPFSVLRLPN